MFSNESRLADVKTQVLNKMLNVSTSPANDADLIVMFWNGNIIWVFRIHKSVTNLEKKI